MSKADKDGWIRHRGGKCPVGDGVIVEARNRSGDVALACGTNCTSVSWHWSHDKHQGDIMAYKIHKQAEQVSAMEKIANECCALSNLANKLERNLSGPIQWRDRITEIDATTQALTVERAELVQKLASEGFALIGRINDLLTDAAQKHEDMSDWRNWKAGDLVECATGEYQDVYTRGCNYAVKEVKASAAMVYDDCGHGSACDLSDSHMDKFKWHTRPSA